MADLVGTKYRCKVCGKEVVVTKPGGGDLYCCGEPMEKIGFMKCQPG